jgi:dihydrofolate synthase/folylpolyglutamate synthase
VPPTSPIPPDSLKRLKDLSSSPPWVDPLLERLFPELAKQGGVRWGLHKTRGLLDLVGSPHESFDVVHVGGTNGKGSVSALVASVLHRAGHRVGLYTSPHLVRFSERIQVDGAPLPEAQLLALAEELRGPVVASRATFFEATTALAFSAFARSEVDIAVVEVGLGGRLDSTNVVTPLVSVITNIGMDHAHYLGDTLVEIAGEKAGIIKAGVPVVTGVAEAPILDVISGVAEEQGAPCLPVTRADILDWSTDAERTRVTVQTDEWGAIEVDFALAGSHQALNGAVAVRTLEALPERYRPTAEEVKEGLAAAHWPGRFERREVHGRFWVFDVAHNLPGVDALVDSAREIGLGRPWIVVMGVLNDKDWSAMTARIATAVDTLILTLPPSFPEGRRWDPSGAADLLRASIESDGSPQVEVIPELRSALLRASELAQTSDAATVFVTGSCHTVGDVFLELGIEPFA